VRNYGLECSYSLSFAPVRVRYWCKSTVPSELRPSGGSPRSIVSSTRTIWAVLKTQHPRWQILSLPSNLGPLYVLCGIVRLPNAFVNSIRSAGRGSGFPCIRSPSQHLHRPARVHVLSRDFLTSTTPPEQTIMAQSALITCLPLSTEHG
jgi:hypothetical protein